MQNAFNLAQQLFSVSTTGGANTSSATLVNATFPAAKINTMANIVADCINSGGVTSSSSPCYTLLENATSTGVAGSGVIPSDTASALINITHNVQSNVSAIYALASNPYAPYTPTLTGAPADFVMPITYSAPTMYDPYEVVIDGNGYVLALSDYKASGTAGPTITRFSPTTGFVGTSTLSAVSGAAIDQSNNILLVNINSNVSAVTKYASSSTTALGATMSAPSLTGAPLTPAVFNGKILQPFILVGPTNNVELDGQGTIYNSNYVSGAYQTPTVVHSDYYLTGFTENGAGTNYYSSVTDPLVGYTTSSGGTGSFNPGPPTSEYVTVDAEGRVWVTGSVTYSNPLSSYEALYTSTLSPIGAGLNTNSPAGGSSNYTGVSPIVMDGLSTAWYSEVLFSYCRLNSFTTSPALNYPNVGVFVDGTSTGSCAADGAGVMTPAVDSGGNIWVPVISGSGSGYIVEMLGIAAPTIQPLSIQVQKLLPTNTSFDIRP
jgi:hypothetical protein